MGAPRSRALPALGARLGSRPRLARAVLAVPQRLPIRRLRAAAVSHVTTPLVYGMDAQLEVAVVGGSRMRVDTTDVAGRMLATSGVWEPHVTAVVRSVLRPGDVVVDVGANIGYFTLLAARLVGSSGRVHALEPSVGTYERLVANLELNDAANVVPERVAAGVSAQRTGRRHVAGGAALEDLGELEDLRCLIERDREQLLLRIDRAEVLLLHDVRAVAAVAGDDLLAVDRVLSERARELQQLLGVVDA